MEIIDTGKCWYSWLSTKKGLYTTFLLSFDLLLKSVNTRIFRLVILGSTYNVFYTNNSNHKWGVSSMLYSCYCTIDLNQLLTKSTVRIFKTQLSDFCLINHLLKNILTSLNSKMEFPKYTTEKDVILNSTWQYLINRNMLSFVNGFIKRWSLYLIFRALSERLKKQLYPICTIPLNPVYITLL